MSLELVGEPVSEEVRDLLPGLIKQACDLRDSVVRPPHSNFRVAAVVCYRDPKTQTIKTVDGCNFETACLSGAICAERHAFLQLRLLLEQSRLTEEAHPTQDKDIVRCLVLATDSDDYVSPGPACREFMAEHFMAPDTPIVLTAPTKDPRVTNLQRLWPHASVYAAVHRSQVVDLATELASRGSLEAVELPAQFPLTLEQVLPMVAEAKHLANQGTRGPRTQGPTCHPVHFCACAAFDDGETAYAVGSHGVEFPCSFDSIAKLAFAIEKKAATQTKMRALLIADNFGVLHAPFAHARSYLAEHGHATTWTLLHEPDGGVVCTQLGRLYNTKSLSIDFRAIESQGSPLQSPRSPPYAHMVASPKPGERKRASVEELQLTMEEF